MNVPSPAKRGRARVGAEKTHIYMCVPLSAGLELLDFTPASGGELAQC